MHPILVHLGPIPIHTYGFMIAVGFLAAVTVIRRLAERAKLDVEKIMDLTFWTLMVGFVGARVLFIITRWEDYLQDPMAVFRVWEGGLVFLGGPIAVVPFFIWFTRKHKLPIWRTMDAMIPGLAIAHMFGRFGCLAAGCCYGKPTGTDFGIQLHSDLVDLSLRGVNLHPTQLYEATGLFVLFLGLLLVFRYRRFDGQVILTYFMAYPILRSIVEVFRGDVIRGFVIEDVLSTSQFLSGIIFLAAMVTLIIRLRTVHGGKKHKT